MRAVVQRVRDARVEVGGTTVGAIARGVLVYFAATHPDTDSDARYLAGKVVNLRIFPDSGGKMNLSLCDLRSADSGGGWGVLVVSQFTLYGDVRKGRRPSYNDAATPEVANRLYDRFLAELEAAGIQPQAGRFREHMDVTYTNDGPVTILVDTANGT